MDVVAIADGSGDHVFLLGAFCLFGRDDALLDLPIDEGVVFGQLRREAITNPIHTAVTDLRENETVGLTKHCGKSRTHPALAAVEFRHPVDHVRRGLHCRFENALDTADSLTKTGSNHPVYRLDGLFARDFAGRLSPHAVCDHPKAEFIINEESVLVVFPPPTNIRLCVGGQSQTALSHILLRLQLDCSPEGKPVLPRATGKLPRRRARGPVPFWAVRALLAAYIVNKLGCCHEKARATTGDDGSVSDAFEFRTETRSPLVRAVVQRSRSRSGVGVLFLTGRLATEAAHIAEDLAAHDLKTEWLIICGVGVLSCHGEIEGESGAVGMRLPVRARVVLGRRGDVQFATSVLSELRRSVGSTACIFLRGDERDDSWLAELRSADLTQQSHIYGGGSLPGAAILLVANGNVQEGSAASLVFTSRVLSHISTSSACRLLSPLGDVTRSEGPTVHEIDHLSALERLEESTVGLEAGSLVLLAVGAGERPLDPAGRSLALRPILGVDPSRGSILIDEPIPPNATVAFAVRDAHSARTDLDAHLRTLRNQNAGSAHGFGIYVSCAGRGRSLYKSPDVDTRIIAAQFPNMPFVGLQSTFEIAPLSGALTPQLYAGVLGVFSLPS